MPERKTVGQLMEEMRLKTGAQKTTAMNTWIWRRFAEDTRHMIIFDVLTDIPRWAGKVNGPACFLTGGRIPEKPGERGKGTPRFSAMPKCARAICTMTAPTSCAERNLPC